jgi:uncharacterized membrane protein
MMKQSSNSLVALLHEHKRWGIWGTFTLLFVLAVFLTVVSYYYHPAEGILSLFARFHFEAMLIIALGGVIVGASGMALLSKELRQTTQSLHENTQLLVSFLTPEERACVQLLQEKEGKCYQHELAKLPGMTRLKAHRLVQRLQDRKLIVVHEMGKARLLELSKSLISTNQPPISPPA